MTCAACGVIAPRLTLRQRYCPDCNRRIEARYAPRPEPAFTPRWRRRDLSRDETALVLR